MKTNSETAMVLRWLGLARRTFSARVQRARRTMQRTAAEPTLPATASAQSEWRRPLKLPAQPLTVL